MKRLAALLVTFLQARAFAQLANSPPVPAWLDGAPAYTKAFDHNEPLLMAVLLVATDRAASVTINEHTHSVPACPTRAVSLDIPPHLLAHVGRST